jgi:hypothetical protein
MIGAIAAACPGRGDRAPILPAPASSSSFSLSRQGITSDADNTAAMVSVEDNADDSEKFHQGTTIELTILLPCGIKVAIFLL